MLDSQAIIGLVFPLVFVVLGIIMNRLMANVRNGKERTFSIQILKSTQRFPTSVQIELSSLRQEIVDINKGTKNAPFIFLGNDTEEVEDIRELDPGIAEISVGIELCVGAISANLTNVIQIVDKINRQIGASSLPFTTPGLLTSSLLPALKNGVFLLTVSFIILIVTTILLKSNKDSGNRATRLSFIWGTNLLGVAIAMVSFFVLGRIIQ